MKQSALRLCCAFLLMSMATAISAGTIGAAFADSPHPAAEAALWVRVVIVADKPIERIRLETGEGMTLQTLVPDASGQALTEPLAPQRYRAVTQYGSVEFLLHASGTVEVQSGCGWSDGERLHLTDGKTGTLTLDVPLVGDSDGWLDFVLTNGETRRREVVRYAKGDQSAQCIFEGVPFGTYTLEESGVKQCMVILDARTPQLNLTLSGRRNAARSDEMETE